MGWHPAVPTPDLDGCRTEPVGRWRAPLNNDALVREADREDGDVVGDVLVGK